MSAWGAAISVYYYLIQRFPTLTSAACDPSAPCTSTTSELCVTTGHGGASSVQASVPVRMHKQGGATMISAGVINAPDSGG